MAGRQTKRARRLARAQEVRDRAPLIVHDEYGLRVDWLRPGGGAERVRVTWDVPFDTDVALMSVPRVLQLVDELTAELVGIHRDLGDSWEDIAFYLESSADTVRRRYGGAA